MTTLQSLSHWSLVRNFIASCSHHTSMVRTSHISIPTTSPTVACEGDLIFTLFSLLHTHSLEALHSFSTISHSHRNFSHLQSSVVYVCIAFLLCIAIAHCFSSIITVFADVIMHHNTGCPLTLVLLLFFTDFFSFTVTLCGLKVKHLFFFFSLFHLVTLLLLSRMSEVRSLSYSLLLISVAPILRRRLEPLEVAVNHVAKFTCEVETAPNVRFQWYRAGREIYDGDKYSIRSSNYLSTLEIPRPQVVDCGEYSCKASNQHGSVSSTALLTVTGKYRLPSTSRSP